MTSSTDSTELTFSIAGDSLNEIKLDGVLCTSESTCYLKIESGAFRDMAENEVVPSVELGILELLNMKIQTLVVDNSGPRVESFDLSMDTGRLKLTFSEAVDVSSLQPQSITLMESSSGGSNYTLVFSENSQITQANGVAVPRRCCAC